jgi:hypothetical protein
LTPIGSIIEEEGGTHVQTCLLPIGPKDLLLRLVFELCSVLSRSSVALGGDSFDSV